MNRESAIEAIRQKLSRGTSAVSAGIADLRDRIREKREDLRHAERAPLPLEDLRKRIVARVEADGEERLRRYGGQLVAGERSLGAWVPKNRLINLPRSARGARSVRLIPKQQQPILRRSSPERSIGTRRARR